MRVYRVKECCVVVRLFFGSEEDRQYANSGLFDVEHLNQNVHFLALPASFNPGHSIEFPEP